MEETKKTVEQIVVERVIEKAINEKRMPWLRPWNKAASINWNTCKEYTGINRFLVPDGEYLTFKQAMGNKFSVNKGSKSHMIVRKVEHSYVLGEKGFENLLRYLKPLAEKYMGVGCSRDNIIQYGLRSGFIKKDKNGKYQGTRSSLMYYNIFNVKDIVDKDGNPVKTRLEKGDISFEPLGLPQEIVENYIAQEGISIIHGKSDAVYSISRDEICLPDENKFRSVEVYYSTLFHLMAHSTAKVGRIYRELTRDNMGHDSFSFEELIANFAASMICAETGIYEYQPEIINNDVAYIQEWGKVFKEKPSLLTRAASIAERVKKYILKYSVDEISLELNSGDE